ncbi:MAG: hypothetical protein HYZ71_08810 [Deltaproteobacteria bacterium]|nr:hypothetical protein [Deltaproteobacteria bacterium]
MIRRAQALFLFLLFLVMTWLYFVPAETAAPSVARPILPVPQQSVDLPKPRQQTGSFLMAGIGVSAVPSFDRTRILARADQFVKANAEERTLRAEHQLKGVVSQSPIGATVSYDVYQGQLPIVGMRIEVTLDNDGNVTGSNWNYRPIDIAPIDASGQALYDEMVNRMPNGFQLRQDHTPFSEVVFELPGQGRGEHSVVVPALNQFKSPVSLILRASDGALLSVEMPRYEVDRQNRR